MAGYNGISKINGIAVGNIAKITGRTKADVFNISSTPRESNLYQALINDSWATYTQGVNYASFVAVGDSSGAAEVYFQYDSHSSGDTYNFTFNKTGTTGSRIFELRISEDSGLNSTTGGGSFDVGASTGAVSTSITASSTNSTIYIGFKKTSGTSTDTLTINNFRVTKS